MSVVHGGRRRAASIRYGIPEHEWLDLSTGIAPWSWPVPSVPVSVWSRLPEADDGLLEAAAGYYGCEQESLAALPGSQFAVRELPRLLTPATVAVPAVGYTEHAHAWQVAGHRTWTYDSLHTLAVHANSVDHAVVLQPNNPTGENADAEELEAIQRSLGDGRLIVDAAFADCQDDIALPGETMDNGIVLRSAGKFFGLAGIRLGFAIGSTREIERLRQATLPWGVANPARWIGRQALTDIDWQAAQRRRIRDTEKWLRAALANAFPRQAISSAGLFATVWFDDSSKAPCVHKALAQHGVLSRLGDNHHWLRFGLPSKAGHPRLTRALDGIGSSDPDQNAVHGRSVNRP